MSEYAVGPYIGTVITIATTIGLAVNSLIDHSMSLVHFGTCAAYLVVLVILHLTRNEEALRWATDFYIASHAVYILTNFMFVPIASLGKTIDTILYITNYMDTDLALPFNGLIHIHEAVWGSFIAILGVLPIIYLAITRRKS